jgi:hypothetical protein
MQNNGLIIPNQAVFISSGSLSVAGPQTGSVSLNFDAYALRLKRFEIFHSGSSVSFDVSLKSSAGPALDPRDVVVEYDGVKGSDDYSSGLDQIEDLIAKTDASGNLHLNVVTRGSGNNTFLYQMFLEAVYVYI